jgi:uncharacterized protein YjbJ (UPF0337 family)
MYWDDQVTGNWKQYTGAVKTRWVLLTEDDLTIIAGKRDQLIVLLQERYRITRDEVKRQVDEWEHAQSAADLEVTR